MNKLGAGPAVAAIIGLSLAACSAAPGADAEPGGSSTSEITSNATLLGSYRTFRPWGWLENTAQSCLAGATGAGNSLTGTESGWCDSTFGNLGELFRFDPNSGHVLTWHNDCVVGAGGAGLFEGNCPQFVAANESWFFDQWGELRMMADDMTECMNVGRGYATAVGCNQWATQTFNAIVNRNIADAAYIPSTIAPFAPAQTGFVMGVHGGHANNNVNGTVVDLRAANTDAIAERWWYDPATREIHLTDSDGMCLDVRGMATTNGTYVQIWKCLGGTNQQWVYVYPNQWVSVQSGKCLDVPGGQVNDGWTFPWIWDCYGGLNQQWDGPHAAGGPQRGY